MRYEGRFVVETHAHIATLYKPDLRDPKTKELVEKGLYNGLNGMVEICDNSAICLYDMEHYSIDMCILLPSVLGTTNEIHAELVDKHPDKFRACCSSQTLDIKAWRGEAEWTVEAACEEIETALKTGKYVGIGEGVNHYFYRPDTGGKVFTFQERLNDWRKFMDVAAKYDVPIYFHDACFPWVFHWDAWELLRRLSGEYPNVSIVVPHGGYSYMSAEKSEQDIGKACWVIGLGAENIYLEVGNWPAEYYKIPLGNPNVGATKLIWGGEYCAIPRLYISRMQRPADMCRSLDLGFQTDWWGWGLQQIRKIRDWGWATQDEINLIVGGNAARVFKLPVPHERMFPTKEEIHTLLGPASGISTKEGILYELY